MDYPRISGVSTDSTNTLTKGVEELRYIWTIPRYPEYLWNSQILWQNSAIYKLSLAVQSIRVFCRYSNRKV